MKNKIKEIVRRSLERAFEKGALSSEEFGKIGLEEPKLEVHGDFSTNIAMTMAKSQKMAPRKIAEAIADNLEDPNGIIEKTEIAGPGFLNFFLTRAAWYPVLETIHEQDDRYGSCGIGTGKKIQVEFVSSNPTGPLHVGHGRGAAVGDSVANILSFCGYSVQKEYYVNDSGRQINTLGRSVFLRYKALFGESIEFPEECYQGEYIVGIAEEIREQKGDSLIGADEKEAVDHCTRYAADRILAGIRNDLVSFGVEFDQWFSEQSLYDSGRVEASIGKYRDRGIIYENDGALWFKTSDFGDEKDRVVVKKDGDTTYFASDIAYHAEKYERGFDRVIDVWGADHHGYIPRMTAAIVAEGHGRDQFDVVLVNMVNLLRDGVPVAMSTRAGEFEPLRNVLDEVGTDAARFIFLTRHYESPLDFDLELAKRKTNDNPVFYVQYVHARISSILEKGAERGIGAETFGEQAARVLKEPEEIRLIKILGKYPETVMNAAEFMEPHRITYYLMNLSSAFHAYYNKHRVLVDDPALASGRLYLATAIRKVIRNGLTLLGVSAPEKM